MRAILIATALLIGCGDDDGGVDGGPDASTDDCVFVEVGATGGDGSSARPFGTIDEALTLEPTDLCLGEGTHAPPSVALSDVRVRGVGLDTRISGACRDTMVYGPLDDRTAAVGATLIVEGVSALQRLSIGGCPIGIHARAQLTLDVVLIDDIVGGVAIGGDGFVSALDLTVRPGTSSADTPIVANAGLLGSPGSTINTSAETRIEGNEGTFGVLGRGGSLSLGGTIDGGSFGVWLEEGVSARLSDLTATGIRRSDTVGGGSRIDAPSIDIEGGAFEGEVVALILEGAAASSVLRTRFDGGEADLVVLDSTLSFEDLVVTPDAIGIAAGGSELTGDLESTSTATDAVHVVLQNAELTGSLDLTGGSIGLLSDGSRATSASFTSRVSTLGVAATGASSIALTTVDVDAGDVGLAAFAGSTLAVRGGTIAGARVGVLGADGTSLELEDLAIPSPGLRGVNLYGTAGDPSTLTNLTVSDSGDIGVQIREHTVTVAGGLFTGSPRGGIETSANATTTVTGAELRANARLGVGFYDAQGSVTNGTFGGTLPMADRADEVRVVAEAGTTREVTLDANTFVLDVTRDCSAGGCNLVLVDGTDAVGIVMPNCLVESAGELSTNTLVTQDGGTLTTIGPSGWADLLAGRAADLGLPAGSPSTGGEVDPPAVPTLPTLALP